MDQLKSLGFQSPSIIGYSRDTAAQERNMHISTANLDLLLQRLNPEPDRDMYDLAVGVREITVSLAAALEDIDSQLSEIKEHLRL